MRAGCVVLLAVPALLGINLLAWLAYLPLSGPIDAARRSHSVGPATVREGVPIPAGSHVEDASIGSRSFTVQLSAPITAEGLRWTGELEVSAPELDAKEGILTGTLAEAAVYQGMPCGAGKASISHHYVSCVLSRNLKSRGYSFASGTELVVRFDDQARANSIDEGTAAAPFRVGDTLWPAGVVLKPSDTLGEEAATKQLGVPGAFQSVCVLPGMSVPFRGVLLHGPAEVRFEVDYDEAANSCGSHSVSENSSGSLRMPDGTVHRQGVWQHTTHLWEWHDENVPATFVDRTTNPDD